MERDKHEPRGLDYVFFRQAMDMAHEEYKTINPRNNFSFNITPETPDGVVRVIERFIIEERKAEEAERNKGIVATLKRLLKIF
jgi:hypothetical protein